MSVPAPLLRVLMALLLIVGQSSAADDATGAIRFQRVFAPEDRIKDWPKGEGRYLPIDAVEFERMLEATRPRAGSDDAPPVVAIAAARYSARLIGDHLAGHARLQVALSGAAPAMLNFEPCNLALRKAEWEAVGGADAVGEATLGRMANSAALGLASDGNLTALVEQSGSLRFDWSLAGHRDSPEVLSFAFELPRAPANELSIELPEGLEPAIDHGLIAHSEPAGDQWRRWQIVLGGSHRFRLRVLPLGTPAKRPQLALLRESRTYDFSPRGVELAVQWRLQVHNEPLRQITVAMETGLHMVSARFGDVSLPMSVTPATDRSPTRVILMLPEPIRDAERTVRLNLVGPVELRKPWRLPGVRAEGLFWQEGTITLLIPHPLEIEQIEPVSCAQTAVGPLAAPRAGESLQFHSYEPGASVTLSMVRPAPALQALSATEIELANGEASARVVANFLAKEMICLELQADVAEPWIVDAVESTPPEAITDWTLEPQAGAGQRLVMRLDPALSPARPLRLVVRARRPFAAHQDRLGISDFAPIRFLGVTDARQFVAVQSIAGYELKLSGERQLQRLRATDLGPDDKKLFAATPRDLLFELGPSAKPLAISLADTQRPVQVPGAGKPGNGLATTSSSPVSTCRLESWYQPDGAVRHQATYDINGAEPRSMRLRLPPEIAGSGLHGVWINGQPVEWQTTSSDNGRQILLSLPGSQRLVNVRIQWTAFGTRLGIVGTVAGVQPEPDLPVQAGTWMVRLPPGYEIASSEKALSWRGAAGSWGGRLLSVWGHWLGAPADGQSLPQPAERDDTEGWTVWQTDLPAADPFEQGVVHIASMQLLGIVVLLLTAALACWQLAARPLTLALLVVVFAVAAIAVPVAYAPLASGGMLGAVFSLVWRSLRRRLWVPIAEDSVPRMPVTDSTMSRGVPLGLMLAVSLAALHGLVARADTEPKMATQWAPSADRSPPIYRVLVPIDARKKPTGGKVYVPEVLYQELYGRGAATGEPRGYLILNATYRGALTDDGPSRRLGVDLLRAHYDIQVFAAATRVRIALGGEGASVVAGGVLLDGRPIEVQTEADAAALAFDVAEPGRYRLEISIRPTGNNASGAGGFDIAIPRLPQSRFELTLPVESHPGASSGEAPVEVPSARGAVRVEGEPLRLSADLGPAERLTVRWHEPRARVAVAPVFDVDQLLWLKIQPGSVVISTKLKFQVVSGSLQQVQVAVDPRLRLLPLSGVNPPSAVLVRESGEARHFAFHWERPVGDQTELEATFLLSGATGVGTFHLPRIEVLEARSTRRLLAASVDPTLERDERQKEQLDNVRVAEFLRAWETGGPATAALRQWGYLKPIAAYRLPPGEIAWNLSSRPQEPHCSAQSHLSLGYDVDHVDVVLDAHVSTASGYLFQYRLTGPKDLKIEDISLLEEGINRVSRWSQDASGRITVFLNGAASGEQKLVLRGRQPITVGQASPLPYVGLERCELRSTTVRIFRSATVRVAAEGSRPPAKVPPMPGDMAESALGRFVEAFSYEGSKPPFVTVTTSIGTEPSRMPQ